MVLPALRIAMWCCRHEGIALWCCTRCGAVRDVALLACPWARVMPAPGHALDMTCDHVHNRNMSGAWEPNCSYECNCTETLPETHTLV